jgi:hypothetical protein
MCDRQVDYVSPSTFMPNAAYLPYRRYLVDWMSDVGEQCRLHNTTIHVSILYLDKIFRSREIPRNQWKLIATACISIAAKYEEAEEHCPPIPDLLQLTKLSSAGYTSLTFREGELEVLKHLGWRLRAIPSLHAIGYFLAKGVTFVDDTWQGRSLIEKIPKYVKKYAEFFANLCQQGVLFIAGCRLPTHFQPIQPISCNLTNSPSCRVFFQPVPSDRVGRCPYPCFPNCLAVGTSMETRAFSSYSL